MVRYNKKTLIIGISFIGLIILGIIGFTYAFFTAGVEGNSEATESVIETADLRLVFNDTQIITMNNVLPGASQTKTFTISNIGNRKISYNINIIDVNSTFVDNELVYSLTSTNNGANISNTPLPVTNETLVSGEIEPGITQVYTMIVLFKETGTNQDTNQGAEYSGKLQINTNSVYNEEMKFSIEKTVGQVMANKTTQVNITGENYGTISCTSDNTNIAECTPSQNEISILGKSNGTTNIMVAESNKNIELTYTIAVKKPTVYNMILEDNTAQSDSVIDFSYASNGNYYNLETDEELNDPTKISNGFYYTANNQYGEDSTRNYYFRGVVDNNWISFGGFLWRIVRTTSEGGVKLIYSGDATGISSGFINTSIMFNLNYDSKYHVGYTYNTDLNGYTGVQTNSTIKTAIDTWYTNNLSSYVSYLSDTAVYCNDKSSERIDSYNYINYPAYARIWPNQRPTYACSNTNASRYTVSTSTGNGYLQKSIGLLSTDEIYYAGLPDYLTSNLDTYIMDNASSTWWWTMSPSVFLPAYSLAYGWLVSSSGYFGVSNVDSEFGIRPSISLKSCIIVTEGNGSKSTPYILSNSACT